jgi:hypothetical protein
MSSPLLTIRPRRFPTRALCCSVSGRLLTHEGADGRCDRLRVLHGRVLLEDEALPNAQTVAAAVHELTGHEGLTQT